MIEEAVLEFDYRSGLYFTKEEIEKVRADRRRRRAVFGSDNVARQMNGEGL